jgi:hypothetical protein
MEGIEPISQTNGAKQLTPEERAEVAKLAARDRDVRAHEAAHLAAAGSLANGVEFDYQMGPDGKLYAVGGKVKISVPGGLTPEQALADARQLRAAANAPTDPSGQDMSVSAQASSMEARALEELSKKNNPASQHKPNALPQSPFRGFNQVA